MQCNLRISLKPLLTEKVSFANPAPCTHPTSMAMHFLPLPEFAPQVKLEELSAWHESPLLVPGCPKGLCHSPASCTFFDMRLRLLKGCILRALLRLLFGLVRYIQLGMALSDVLKSLERSIGYRCTEFLWRCIKTCCKRRVRHHALQSQFHVRKATTCGSRDAYVRSMTLWSKTLGLRESYLMQPMSNGAVCVCVYVYIYYILYIYIYDL